MRVLVVDDSMMMRRVIIKALTALGHTDIKEAGNGKEALAVVTSPPGVDLVLTDWNMPEMNGLDFVKALRADASTSGVPVLMVTTNVSGPDVADAMAAGVNDCVTKPFTSEMLQSKIVKVIGS